MKIHHITLTTFLLAWCGLTSRSLYAADRPDEGAEKLVADTHAASLKLRGERLRQTIAKDTAWPSGVWGDNLWTLAALQLNEKVEAANARLLKAAMAYIEANRARGNVPAPTPENPGEAPWTFFSITDYVRTLCLFHGKSVHFPGRITPAAEAAMKEALWLWTSQGSRLADYGEDDYFLLLGTENHDLNIRPVHHLVSSLLQDDPAYKDRKLADGHTTAEHAAVHTAYFREWARRRASSGMWIEVGSTTYQKYSWPALFNLHELSPDPEVRHRFGLLLELALAEEAQISVRGHRGGGRSRADNEAGSFTGVLNLLYGEGGSTAGSSHSRVLETSRYQAPMQAILLRKWAFPTERPFVIRNRVLGELEGEKGEGHRLAKDSALVNYAYRTPHYLLGSTLQNPALNYAGISRQKRTCGMLFENPASPKVSGIHVHAEHIGGGRSQHSFWSVQQENVLLVQRIARHGKDPHGSYNTGKLGIEFDGADLEKIEEGGWIFATDGKAFAGVKFLDGPHTWNEQKTIAMPANHAGDGDTTRILLQSGDVSTHGSFAQFRETLRASALTVTADKVDYTSGQNRLEVSRYIAKSPTTFALPLVNGKAIDLRPEAVYDSPCIKGAFGDDRITVVVGRRARVLDFSKTGN